MKNEPTSYQPQTEMLLDHADKVIKQLHKKSRQTLKEIAIGARLSEADVHIAFMLLMPREKNLVVATTYSLEPSEDVPASTGVGVRCA